MIALISDNVSDSSDSMKEKEFEKQLVNEGYQLVLSNCEVTHTKATLCCKTGLEFEQYYKYLEKHKNETNLPQWFCHVDDDVYVNMKQLKILLSTYNSSEPYYIGRYLWDWKGYNIPPHNAKKLQRVYHTEIKRTKYWLAAGPTYCISLPLMMKLQPYLSKHEISSSPNSGLKATEQKLPRLPSDYEEPPSIPDKDKVDPIYEDVEVTAEQSKDVATSDVKMEDNPSYDTSVL